jgi:hypothetical protein
MIFDLDSREDYVLLNDQHASAYFNKAKSELTLSKKESQPKGMLRDFMMDQKLTSTRNKVENKILEFNLYYSQSAAQVDKNSNTNHQNYANIEIDIEKLKRFEPSLRKQKNVEDLKRTTEDITKCFKFDEEGNLYVDSKKIDPSCIRFKERKILAFTETERERITKHRDRIRELNNIFAKNP